MKRFLFSLLTMFVTVSTIFADVQIVGNNFPDDKFRTYLLSQSYGKDGVITDEEIKNITYMNIDSKNVVSLQGIEYFTALEFLWLFGNSISSLDVSKNTSLTELYCNYNNITNLNVTGCRALKILCCNRNKLTQIDVSECPSLQTLRCDQNQITGSAMDALIAGLPTYSGGELWVIFNESEGNVITTTQIADAKKKGWTAKYYDGSKWQEYTEQEPIAEGIAINEENFPDTNFRNWILSLDYGEDGVLTEEEISNITGISIPGLDIENLQGIEFFTAITILECNSNQLTSLDVSKNTALTSLSCYSNQLTYLNVSGCTALTSLYCYSNQLTSLDVSNNTALTSLYCYSNQLTSLDLSKNIALNRFVCNSNQLTSLDVSNNTALISLYCHSNHLTSLNVSKNTALKNLYCYSNQIYGTAMDALVASLPNVSNGTMNVIYNENEGNVMTTTQVALAKAKGWTPRYYDGVFWQEYTGSEPLKCATPTIIYLNGKLMFYCETEDVKYNYSIVSSVEDGDNIITLPKSCKISVIATKEGYEPSDPLVKEIDMSYLIGKLGDVNGDGEIGMPDVMFIVNYILNGKFPDED